MGKKCTAFVLLVCLLLPFAVFSAPEGYRETFEGSGYPVGQSIGTVQGWQVTGDDGPTANIVEEPDGGRCLFVSAPNGETSLQAARSFDGVSSSNGIVDMVFRARSGGSTQGTGIRVMSGSEPIAVFGVVNHQKQSGVDLTGTEIPAAEFGENVYALMPTTTVTGGNCEAKDGVFPFAKIMSRSTAWTYLRLSINFETQTVCADTGTDGTQWVRRVENFPFITQAQVSAVDGIVVHKSPWGRSNLYLDDFSIGAGSGGNLVDPPEGSPSPSVSTSPTPTPTATPSPSPSATVTPTPTPTSSPARPLAPEDVAPLAAVEVGAGLPEFGQADRLYFGEYPQQQEGEPSPVLWRVLEQQSGRDKSALLLSDQVLDYLPMHQKSWTGVSWSTAPLRNFLNGVGSFNSAAYGDVSFVGWAFGLPEQEAIRIPETVTDVRTAPGVAETYDRIFLLSPQQASALGDNAARKAAPTAYAQSKGAAVQDGGCDYWLRGPGNNNSGNGQYTASVAKAGSVNANGTSTHTKLGIRPALYLDLNSVLFASPIVAQTDGNPALTAESGLYQPGAGGTSYKLTVADYSIPIPTVTGVAGSGSVTQISLSNAAEGDVIAYKVVDPYGSLAGYGRTEVGEGGTISVDASRLYSFQGPTAAPAGYYRLYLWKQTDRAEQCHLGSYPALVPITVE